MPAKSQSPNKRSQSPKKKGPSADDILLDARMVSHEVEAPTQLFMALSGLVSLLPIYLAIFLFEVQVTITHLALFGFVAAATTYMLQKAYTILFYCEYMKRDQPHSEVKQQQDANLLRSMRLELSMARTLYQINIIYLALNSIFQLYIFKKVDPRASLLMAPMLAALVAWFVAHKSEETRKANSKGEFKKKERDL